MGMCYTGAVTTSLARGIGAQAPVPVLRRMKRMPRNPIDEAIRKLDDALARGYPDAFSSAFGEAFDIVRELLLAIAKSKGLELDNAEDAVQDMIVAVWKAAKGRRLCGDQIVGLMFDKLATSRRIPTTVAKALFDLWWKSRTELSESELAPEDDPDWESPIERQPSAEPMQAEAIQAEVDSEEWMSATLDLLTRLLHPLDSPLTPASRETLRWLNEYYVNDPLEEGFPVLQAGLTWEAEADVVQFFKSNGVARSQTVANRLRAILDLLNLHLVSLRVGGNLQGFASEFERAICALREETRNPHMPRSHEETLTVYCEYLENQLAGWSGDCHELSIAWPLTCRQTRRQMDPKLSEFLVARLERSQKPARQRRTKDDEKRSQNLARQRANRLMGELEVILNQSQRERSCDEEVM